jgi:hypothetical protein
MKFIRACLASVLLILIATGATAQSSIIQEKRIEQGIKSGELTRHERRQLARQQRRIRREQRRANADGVVTKKEKRKIRREKRKADRNIFRKKHNRRDNN